MSRSAVIVVFVGGSGEGGEVKLPLKFALPLRSLQEGSEEGLLRCCCAKQLTRQYVFDPV